MPEGLEAEHNFELLKFLFAAVVVGSLDYICEIVTHWRWPATLETGGSQKRRRCVCCPGCRGAVAHDANCPRNDAWFRIETADRRPLQADLDAPDGHYCAHEMQFVDGRMPKSLARCEGEWPVVQMRPSNKQVFIQLQTKAGQRGWYVWQFGFQGEVVAADSEEEQTGYNGPGAQRASNPRWTPGAGYTLMDHPYVQCSVHFKSGRVVVLFDQSNMAAFGRISATEMLYRMPHVLNKHEWRQVVLKNYMEEVEVIDGVEVVTASVTLPVYKPKERVGEWVTYNNLQQWPVVLFILAVFSQVFGKYHAVEALYAAGIAPFEPATAVFRGSRWRRVEEYLRLHHALAASSIADEAEVQAQLIRQLNHVYNVAGGRALHPSGQPRKLDCADLSLWYPVGDKVLWLPAEGPLGALYRSDIYGPICWPTPYAHQGGAFAGFRSDLFRPATVTRETDVLQAAPAQLPLAVASRLANEAKQVVDLPSFRSFMKAVAETKAQRAALEGKNPVGRPAKDRRDNKEGKPGRPPLSRGRKRRR